MNYTSNKTSKALVYSEFVQFRGFNSTHSSVLDYKVPKIGLYLICNKPRFTVRSAEVAVRYQ